MSSGQYRKQEFAGPSVRFVRVFCVIAIVSGVLLFAAAAYTGYVEGVRADESHTAGSLMPAEVAGFILGPVLASVGSVLLYQMRGQGR